MTTEQLIYSMLIENTGAHPLDSGGAYGRQWQRNQNKTIDDFRNEPEALFIPGDYPEVWLSLFHHLNKTLEQDELCRQFNALPCDNWDGDFYGTSSEQCEWLENNGFIANDERGEFNSYNWSSNLSQVVQGSYLLQGGYLDDYVLLQVHGGCDVRGGYTDAKLFKISNDYFLWENASFSISDNKVLDVRGDDVSIYDTESHDDEWLDYSAFEALAKTLPEKQIIGSQLF